MALLSEINYRPEILRVLINGEWRESESTDFLPVFNPATGETISKVPLASKDELDRAANSSQEAFEKWKNVPLTDRVQYLFRMKQLFEDRSEELARINTQNHGKTITESRGDVRRTIDNIESAISAAYVLMKGENLDQISEGIDEATIKEPLGVFGIICPFNFPLMVPFWYLPYAIALGCTVIVKPSEITPIPFTYVADLITKEIKLPPGVINLVHGSKDIVDALISHPKVKGVTFVGSTPVGRHVYELAGAHGKRAIVQAGAKNSILVMPDADVDFVTEACLASTFGNAGQRCLAGSNIIVTQRAHDHLLGKLTTGAKAIKVGNGLDETSQMGPLVSKRAKDRVLEYIGNGIAEGARPVVDGRNNKANPKGYFLGPTILDEVTPNMRAAKEEIFGPLATVVQVQNLDDAIEFINTSTSYGNAASIFTKDGRNAREFRRRVLAGNIGINIGVAAPLAYFPFGGMRDSFFGVLHGQVDSVDFFTDRKVIISRW
jgi:malonate-semialdehyde dehydrogenase (acetylating)/methylmalonate-semialdehyde dehydrogenase